jgi:GntR family transcriptional regulator
MPTNRLPTNRFSTRALYQQVRDVLAARIAAGDWKPGVALPNEGILARELGVSPGTTRKALSLLEAERLLTRRQGHGTFVNDPASDARALRYSNIYAVDGERIVGEANLVRVSEAPANQAQCARLQLHPQDLVCQVRWVRLTNGKPFMLEDVSVPSALFPGLSERKDIPCRIAVLAQEFGILLGKAEERVFIGAAAPDNARMLGLDPGAPILGLDRLVYSIDGRPVEWSLRQANLANKYYVAELG